ncbi:MAG: DNA replication/repair protein RecF [Deltaproteobacteria bacterium]|nr:DNA replication/repair protein RecF [Deltaproteobacteria bacterium]
MRLLRAEFFDFRNIASAAIEFSPHCTVFVGHNGQGKTNLIEGLYVVAGLRPLRNVARRALIRRGAEKARVAVSVRSERTGLTHDLSVSLSSGPRLLMRDSKRVDTEAFVGHLVAVAFTPDDLDLPKGGPDARRRFLDRALFNLRPAHLARTMRYQRALRDRNRLLTENASDASIAAFDEIVAREGASISLDRDAYLVEIGPLVESHFAQIARPAPKLRLTYENSLGCPLGDMRREDLTEALLKLLHQRRLIDRKRKKTSVGPHLDDLTLTLDSLPAKEHASQGQHRAIVLALKLAEIVHLSSQLGEPPLLLLDDMSSELDHDRGRQLFETVNDLKGQVVVTSTDPAVAGLLGHSDLVLHRVSEGHVAASA